MSASAADAPQRLRIRVRGAVQGVGFRPFVFALARRFELSGFVLNDDEGVLAEIEGRGLDRFLEALTAEPPRLARVTGVEVTPVSPEASRAFTIEMSRPTARRGRTGIVPDTVTCRTCRGELFDPASRFYLYPFVTCTQCGPRLSILKSLPYDRPQTAMAGFALCTACRADYADPSSRRFHAETIACARCGPRLSHSLDAVARGLRRGRIVALKGIGGFNLFCNAADEAAVTTLRRRKGRPDKPFAVMVANVAAVAAIAAPTPAEDALLQDAAGPIVLLRGARGLAPSVAPGLDAIGVMLPSSPVHHLLFHALSGNPAPAAPRETSQICVLVATSANAGGQPLVIEAAEARQNLADIADLIVTHDRPILERMDDSVMAMIDGAPAFIRRARGFVPEPIDLGEDGPAVIAVGAHLKATLCITRGREAFVSQHIGDLATVQTVGFFEQTAQRMLRLLGVVPELVACDLHPDYRSTLFAEATGLPVWRVQHHAAHLAAVAAEHNLRGQIMGVALDGHGYGDRGSAWGGELMLLEGACWRRIGHLWPLSLPGGDRAAREPWRMGVAALTALGRGAEAARRFPRIAIAGRLAAIIEAGDTGALTTSMGRLFDAAAALLGLCPTQSHEGQAAMRLEALVRSPRTLPGGFAIRDGILDFRPLLEALLQPGLTAQDGAELFHGTAIAGLAEWVAQAAGQASCGDIVLGGGCFVNRVLAEGLALALRARGLKAWLPRAVPANDGGLSLGQAAMARAHLMAETAALQALRN